MQLRRQCHSIGWLAPLCSSALPWHNNGGHRRRALGIIYMCTEQGELTLGLDQPRIRLPRRQRGGSITMPPLGTTGVEQGMSCGRLNGAAHQMGSVRAFDYV